VNEIRVETTALEAAAGVIATAAMEAGEARRLIARAGGAGAGAFGGEPIGASLAAMERRAASRRRARRLPGRFDLP